MKVWPTARGDHRAAMRGRGAGASRGRVRWTWASGGPIGMVLVGEDRIFVQVEDGVHVLDGGGGEVSRISGDGHLSCLLADLLVLAGEKHVVALDRGGEVRWRHEVEHAIRAIHAGPRDELTVWTLRRSHPLRQAGVLDRLDVRGLAWTEPYPLTLAGHVFATELAFDDEGTLYSAAAARMGDGVSGDDTANGGIAAHDHRGCRWARRADAVDVHALAEGAVFTGLIGDAFAVATDGAVAWRVEDRDEQRVSLGDVRLRVDEKSPTVLLERGPGSFTRLTCAIDDAGNRTFAPYLWGPPRSDRIISIDPEHRLRWQLELTPIDWAFRPPVIGLDGTVLFAHGQTLLAIE